MTNTGTHPPNASGARSFAARIRALQRLEWPSLWLIPVPFVLLVVFLGHRTGDAKTHLISVIEDILMYLVIFSFFFQSLIVFRSWISDQDKGLSFLFSRAVDRRALFILRSIICCLFSLSFSLLFLVHACFDPALHLYIPPGTPHEVSNYTAFYFENYPGTELLIDAASGKRTTIALPHGRITVALFALSLTIALTLIGQWFFSLLPDRFWKRRYLFALLALTLFFCIFAVGPSREPCLTTSDQIITWIGRQAALVIPLLLLAGLLSQFPLCRRFVRREVLS